ncbi:cytidylyltransferase domain-containing protein [Acidovorax sp. LjRoot117]|uniref:cytidylyltransferase domain-containing protein n=1 Tax=Acidovorax sp. LjRoot117 TaxID=3342255 RepID=UPI003ECE0A3D
MSNTHVLAILQARMSSSRLPGKVLLRTCGKPLLAHQIERVGRCKAVSRLVVATSTDSSDDAIEELCRTLGVAVHRGSLDDVLNRFSGAARSFSPEWIVRLTGDCPLTDPALIDRVVRTAVEGGFDYVSSALNPTFPDGLDAECLRYSVLAVAEAEARLPSEREHVTAFVYSRPKRFHLGEVRNAVDLSALRWTVDEPRDFVFVSQVFERLYPFNPCFSMDDVLQLLDNEPRLATLNGGILRNEGYHKSLRGDCAADL